VAGASPLPLSSPTTDNNSNIGYQSTDPVTFTVTFLPGSMGLQMEPSNGLLGCKVHAFADKGPTQPGQARLSGQIQPGDVVVKLNDEPVNHHTYNQIIARLKQLGQMPRKMEFQRSDTNESTEDNTPLRSLPALTTPVASLLHAEQQQQPKPSVLFMDAATDSPTAVVLDIEEQEEEDCLIDRSSILSPSKIIKNVQQEDLELGLGTSTILKRSTKKNNKPLTSVFRTVFNSVMKGGALDFSSSSANGCKNKLPFQEQDAKLPMNAAAVQREQQKMEESFHKKSQMLQDLSQVCMVVDDIRFDVEAQPEESPKSVKNSFEDQFKGALEQLQKVQNEEANRVGLLKRKLDEATARVAELTEKLTSQQIESEAKAEQIRQAACDEQRARQSDLEQQLQDAQGKIKSLTEVKSKTVLELEQELMEAKARVEQIIQEKDQAVASFEAVSKEVQELRTKTNMTELQVAKLQTELRDSRKENDRLAADVTNIQNNLQNRESSLQEKEKDLADNRCTMERYEEKFIERETEFEALQEEMDFAGRELEFAQSEIQLLKESMTKKEQEAADKAIAAQAEQHRLKESLAMTEKELEELKQLSYDKEHELQTQLNQRTSELNQRRSEAADAAEREQELKTALQQRDADLAALNRKIATEMEAMKDQLQQKSQFLKDNQALLDKNETDKNNLASEVAKLALQCKEYETMHAESLATIQERGLELNRKKEEITFLQETVKMLEHEKSNAEKEIQDLKSTVNKSYQEKSRVAKELQASKIETSETKAEATKIQDGLLEQLKQVENKLKETELVAKQKDQDLMLLAGKLDKTSSRSETLSVALSHKEEALKAASSTIEGLQAERDELTNREIELSTNMSEKERQLEGLEASVVDLKTKLLEATNQISSLEQQTAHLETSRCVSNQEVNSLKAEVETLNAQIQGHRKSLDANALELASKSSQVLALESTIENLRDDVQQQREEIESSKVALVAAQAQYAQLHERFVSSAEESSDKLKSLTTDLLAAQEENADNLEIRSKLERQVLSLNQQIQDRGEILSSTQTKLEIATQKVEDLGKSNEKIRKDADAKIAELFDEITRESALVQELEQEYNTRSKENSTLKEELAGLVKKLAIASCSFSAEQQSWQKKYADLEQTFMAQKDELSTITAQHSAAVAAMGRTEKEMKSLQTSYEDQLSLLRRDVACKEETIAELCSEKDSNAVALSTCREELDGARLEIEGLEESRQRVRDELVSLNSFLEEERADHTTRLEELIKKHKEESNRFFKEKQDIEASFHKSEESRSNLLSQINRMQKLIEEEREKKECLIVEHEALELSLHRAEDLAADLQCELNILKEEQANQSIDSADTTTLALSMSELRTKCKHLTEAVQQAEVRTASGAATVSQKQRHIDRLEADMAELSAELGRMMETSEQLEAALLNARMEKTTAENDAQDLRMSIDHHQAKTAALKDELNQQYNDNSELLDQVRALQSQQKSSNERENNLQQELDNTKKLVEIFEQSESESKADINKLSQQLANATKERSGAQGKISDLESQLAQVKDQCSDCQNQNKLLEADLKRSSARLDEKTRELRNIDSKYNSTISNLEAQLEAHVNTVRTMEEAERTFKEKLEKERTKAIKMGALREEAVSKLAEASRVLASQKSLISAQECKVLETENIVKKLEEEVEALKETIKAMESHEQEHGMLRSSQIEEMEKKRVLLEKARSNAKAEADLLRDEVRQANRRATELDRMNKSLQSRIDELRATAETTKTQLREARGAWTQSDDLARKLENDLQGSKAEVDHLRSKLQLMGATIARLKSDRVLLEEAANKAATNNGLTDVNSREVSKLKSDLHTKSAQLSSAAATLRNYKRCLTEMKTTEKELLVFIDDIILQAEEAFAALQDLATELQEQNAFDEAYATCCSNLASIIHKTKSDFAQKKSKILGWRSQRPTDTPTKTRAAAPASLLSPTEASVLRVFGRVKEVVGTEKDSQIGMVLSDLESQIGFLVDELASTQKALRSKDELFASLERNQKLESIAEDDKENIRDAAAAKVAAKVFESQKLAQADSS